MLIRHVSKSLLYLFLVGTCSCFANGYDSQNHNYPNNERSRHVYGRDDIAQEWPYEQGSNYKYQTNPVREENESMTDWGYKESWRYELKAFFKGETQPEAYRSWHPYGPPGIGYNAAPGYYEYLRYREAHEHQHENPNWNSRLGYRDPNHSVGRDSSNEWAYERRQNMNRAYENGSVNQSNPRADQRRSFQQNEGNYSNHPDQRY